MIQLTTDGQFSPPSISFVYDLTIRSNHSSRKYAYAWNHATTFKLF
jgi:hypothetical protein